MTSSRDVSLASRDASFAHQGEVRKEMIEAYGAVLKAIRQTALRARSAKLDARRTKEYWTTTDEMSARAFESYLISKLQDHDAANDYLANVVSPETWEVASQLGFELEDSYPYPTAGEMPSIRAGFDHFFDTVQTRPGESGNVALFSRHDQSTQTRESGVPTGLPSERNADSDRLEQGINDFLRQTGRPAGFKAEAIRTVSLPDALAVALARFTDATGTRVVLFRNRTPGVDDFNGVNFRDGRIYINEASQHPLTLTAAHEWTHNLKRTHPALYQQLEDEVRRQGRIPEWHARNIREEGMDRGRDHAVEELTAAAVSDALTDPVFLQRLAERDQGVFRRVAHAFLDFLKTLTNGWRDQGSNA
ncbi:MAG: hypothetical protein EPN34_13940 [Burkholderiaceae bacterium]|nr:MAG: hypothetical protein EPN34_13940 [Burkholderiaceae bacterium]